MKYLCGRQKIYSVLEHLVYYLLLEEVPVKPITKKYYQSCIYCFLTISTTHQFSEAQLRGVGAEQVVVYTDKFDL